MFTRGFNLFFGISGAAIVAALVFGFFSGDTSGPDYLGVVDRSAGQGIISLGWKGAIGEPIGYITLIVLAAVALFLALSMVAFRDADPEAVAELAPNGELAPPQAPTEHSWWPLAGALGIGMFAVGLATSPLFWGLGLVILGAVAFEWMMSAWADRATGDPATNLRLRREIMGPIEVPILSLAAIVVAGVAISRILLTVSKLNAVWAATGIAVLILLVGSIVASNPKLGKGIVAAMVGLLTVGVLAAGIASAAVGERDFEHHGEEHDESHSDGEGEGSLGSLTSVTVNETNYVISAGAN